LTARFFWLLLTGRPLKEEGGEEALMVSIAQTPPVPAPASADGDERLPLRTKAAFGVGSAAETIALHAVGSFALLFYNQVLGMPAWLAGLAISISFVFDGFADPIIGSLSDRTHSRLGRRHPYMYAAPIPIALFFFAIFNPPAGMGDLALFFWFTVAVIGLRIAMGVFHTPHLALGGEMSGSYTERSRIMAWNNFATWAGGSAISYIAYTFFFRSTPDYPRGLLNPEPYFTFALFGAGLTMLILFASAWFTHDQIPRLPRPPASLPKFSPFEFLRDFGKALSNRNYLWLLVGFFFLSIMLGVRGGLGLYMATYYWEFTSEQLRWYIAGSFVGFLSAFYFTPRMHAWWGKRRVIFWSVVTSSVFPGVGAMLSLMGLMFPVEHPLLLPTLIVISSGSYATGAVLNISVMSALADIADENEVKFGLRQEGVLYSARSLFAKVDQAIGSVLAGLTLTLIAFPQGAVPGEVDQGVLMRLALVDGPIAMCGGLIASIFYGKFDITERRHAETRAIIAARRAGALAAAK
jgi:Na+/melibiose symporter-like transporter